MYTDINGDQWLSKEDSIKHDKLLEKLRDSEKEHRPYRLKMVRECYKGSK